MTTDNQEQNGSKILEQSKDEYAELLSSGKAENWAIISSEIKLASAKKIKVIRDSRCTPLSAYMSDNWRRFVDEGHQSVMGSPYPMPKKSIPAECIVIKKYVYPLAFYDLYWSSRDLARFIFKQLYELKKKDESFVINMFKSTYCQKLMREYDKQLVAVRKEDLFEHLIYLPHEPLTSDPNDFLMIFKKYKNQKLPLMFCYGLQIYSKVMQKQNGITFAEANRQTIKDFIDNVINPLKNEKETLKKILEGIAKNSILWGPCTNDRMRDGMFEEEEIAFDWQKNLANCWDAFDFLNQTWWKTKEQIEALPAIASVKQLFNKDAALMRAIRKKQKKKLSTEV